MLLLAANRHRSLIGQGEAKGQSGNVLYDFYCSIYFCSLQRVLVYLWELYLAKLQPFFLVLAPTHSSRESMPSMKVSYLLDSLALISHGAFRLVLCCRIACVHLTYPFLLCVSFLVFLVNKKQEVNSQMLAVQHFLPRASSELHVPSTHSLANPIDYFCGQR